MSFEVRKIDAPLGAEICGIDMRDPLDPADRDRLYKAWLDHVCLVFRDQSLSKDQQIDVAGYLVGSENVQRQRIGETRTITVTMAPS